MPKVSLIGLPEWEALRRATADLYEAFSLYSLRDTIPYCTHCFPTEAFDTELRAQPLHELSADTARVILGNPGTWGDEVDVKHFLPRLFELVSLDLVGPPSGLYCGAEILGSRVDSEGTGFMGWPEPERAALTAFCLDWLRAALATWPSSPLVLNETVETVLCAIAQFTDDFTPYLATWTELLGNPASLSPLAHFLVLTCQYVTPRFSNSPNAWWDSRPQYWQQLLRWVEDPETARIAQHTLQLAHMSGVSVDARSFDTEHPPYAADALEWIASWSQEAVQ